MTMSGLRLGEGLMKGFWLGESCGEVVSKIFAKECLVNWLG